MADDGKPVAEAPPVLDGAPAYQAPALDKGLAILEHLASASAPHSMPELAKALNRSKTEIYRMAVVLERRGYIARTSDDRYVLTNRLFDLGMRAPPLRNLHDAAMPAMHRLAETLRQSCHLAVASGDEIVVVARVESPGLLGFAVRVGYRRHIAQATSGQILFALRPEHARDAWFTSLRRTAPPEVDLDGFLALGDAVRRHRFHRGGSAVVDAITDIGAPIYDGAAPGPVAALTMPFVSGRATVGTVDSAVAAVVEAAAAISRILQHG